MSQNSNLVRLQKYIADSGVTSRRKAEDLISQGRVKVNGHVENTLGAKINPEEDVVHVDNQVVEVKSSDKLYIVMNKPRGYVTTSHDPEGRPTVLDLCQDISERIYPVGRLDYNSEGLLLLTNDGDFANQVIHPSSKIIKMYEVKVFGIITEPILKKLKSKVVIEGTAIKPVSVRVIERLKNKTKLEFRLSEGKNREIRKICAHNGITIDKLKRVAIGGLGIEGLGVGKFALVSKKQLIERIGLGDKNQEPQNYFSTKKTVKLKDKKINPSTKLADDKRFYKFRKEHYKSTINNYQQVKKQQQSKEENAKKEE